MTALRERYLVDCPDCDGIGEVGCGGCGSFGEAMSGEGGCPRCGGAGTRQCGTCEGSGERVITHVDKALVCSRCAEHILLTERDGLRRAWLEEHASCRA